MPQVAIKMKKKTVKAAGEQCLLKINHKIINTLL